MSNLVNEIFGAPDVDAKADTAPTRLTIRTPAEILAMTFDPNDCVWGDWLIACGEKTATVGPGGIGKSRLWVQAAICQILGRPFLCFDTHGPAKRWLFLQTENSNRRLQTDLAYFEKWVGPADWKRVCEHLFIHTLENDWDTMLSLDDAGAVERLESAIKDTASDFVVWDVLRDYGIGDLNKDQDMGATLQTIARLTRKGDVQRKRIPVVLHHAGTGKAGAAKAIGYDRASYGRNSKVLFGWARSMINIAPGSSDENPPLVISCGKNNNGAMFPTFAARFNAETHIYELYLEFDLETWSADVSGKTSDKPLLTPERVGQLCKGPMTKAELVKAIKGDCFCSPATAYRQIKKAEKAKRIKFNTHNETYCPR